MPQCVKCGKESNNLRICPFCHAEYPQPDKGQRATPRATFGVVQPRATGATPRASMAGIPAHAAGGGFKAFISDLSPPVKFGTPGLIVAFAVWYVFLAGERKIPVGVVLPNLVAIPMVPAQADAFLRRMKETAKVEFRGTELAVTFPAANFPERRAGQLALAQQYARADEIAEARKRVIGFYDPSGSIFARADASGVMMVR